MTTRLTLTFGDLSHGTAFTLPGYFVFIYEKIGARRAAVVGRATRGMDDLELDAHEPVSPVFRSGPALTSSICATLVDYQ